MIFPQDKDIGRWVVIVENGFKVATGRITAFNDYWVFVQLEGDQQPRGVRRQDLEWVGRTR